MKIFYFIFSLLSTNGFSMTNSLPLLKNHSLVEQQLIKKRYLELGKDYIPRTRHLNTNGSALYVNQLIYEESPYLLQHAHNPVDWHAWSKEAFALAKKQDKPIFISIGYATCHWCHVMEHESFEDIEIAKFINQHFIAIKIDRERRSAIDSYYMTGVQMMTGHGGWPMSNFTLPDGKPFFGGTYYKPDQFLTLLKRVHEVWQSQKPQLAIQAKEMDTAINNYLTKTLQSQSINQSVYSTVNSQLENMHDELLGGFSTSPKFPQEPWLLYLLSQNQKNTKKMLLLTLNEMQQGGIYDQVGGGFHRYATDNEWLAPHFEKMLYNQSQLGEIYTLAALDFNNPEYKRTALAIYDYVLKEMLSPYHVFYSAGDADSEGEEGLFFTWTEDELKNTLSNDEFEWLKGIYHFSKDGNFAHSNILNLAEPLQQTAHRLNISYNVLTSKLDTINLKLYKQREKKVHPLIDNKIITSWNAQMVFSLTNAAYLLNKGDYLNSAVTAMHYLLSKHVNDDGHLVRNSLSDKASTINAELEDYAWMITALIKLYDVTNEKNWLKQAEKLISDVQQLFSDHVNGGFFNNILEQGIPHSSKSKKSEDGAIVSANGQMLIALARYYRRTGDNQINEQFTQSLAAFSGKIVKSPTSHTSMLYAKMIYEKGDNSNITYTGKGNVKISGSRTNQQIQLTFSIKDNWHINSNQINIESLIPLSIESQLNIHFKYPKAKVTQLDFSNKDLSTFEKKFKVTAEITSKTQFPLSLSINLQACSNKICLAPSKINIKVY